MIKIEKTAVYGWDAAIRGMRNSYNSWKRSDSICCDGEFSPLCDNCTYGIWVSEDCFGGCENKEKETFLIGKNDLLLMKKLAKAGDDHSKFARMINVTCDITAPLYWWKELDTYKVGTVANSCSTMHTIQDKEFTLDDFSFEYLGEHSKDELRHIIKYLNHMNEMYNVENNEYYWWQVIQLLPSSYNQKRTVQFNYQVLWNMRKARRAHRLFEWVKLCAWIEKLPYFKEIYLED